MLIIGIAGGSGSGKSTFTDRLKDYFGDSISVIYHDNYYKRQDSKSFEERTRVNYDHPDALDTQLLKKHLAKLRKGEAIECPVYDFAKHNRSDKTLTISPSEVIIVEGILVFSDEELASMFDIKIFVEADADERVLRRVRRDVLERGRDIDGIINQYLSTVKPMHYLYVEPTKSKADIVLNSGLNDVAFELVKNLIIVCADTEDRG